MRSAKVADVAQAGETINAATGRLSSTCTSIMTVWLRAVERWEELQVGRQGSYSVERLESLDNYCKTTSRARVVLVCVLTPIPAFSIAVLLECLPLKSPLEGWAANWVFWIRWTLTFLVLSFSGTSQLITYVPGLEFTLAKRVIVSVGSTAAFVGMCLLGANIVRFPVPFMLQIGSVVMGLCIAAMVRLVFRRMEFARNSPFRPYLVRFYRFLFAYLILGGVYPFFRVVFDLTPQSGRGVIILLLPLWKFAAKHLIVKAIRELEDFIPELVAFTVDFFSALFVSACMTTSGSLYLSVMFIVADVGQSLLEFNEVRTNAKTLLYLLRSRRKSRKRSLQNKDRHASSSETTDLLTLILYVAQHPDTFHVTSLKEARLWACLPHLLTHRQVEQLKELEASGMYGPELQASTVRSFHCDGHWPQTVSIVPVPNQVLVSFPCDSELTTKEPSTPTKDASTKLRDAEKSKKLVLQGLQLLFHCEYLALVEYVECVVPLIFVTYKSILEQLPNIQYYPGGAGNWDIVSAMNFWYFQYWSSGRSCGSSGFYSTSLLLATVPARDLCWRRTSI